MMGYVGHGDMPIVPPPADLASSTTTIHLQTVWIFVSQSVVLLPSHPFLYSSNR
jgi:hypothetical protein